MPAPSLSQDSFAAGMFDGVAPTLIPETGCSLIENGVLDEDGSVRLRGGGDYETVAFSSDGLWGLWLGDLASGEDKMLATAGMFGTELWNVSPGASPFLIGSTSAGFGAPKAMSSNGVAFIGTLGYAGSILSGGYSTGTVSAVAGAMSVTGSGTGWSVSNVDVGSIITIGSESYVVDSSPTSTSLLLKSPVRTTATVGSSYSIERSKAAPYTPEAFAGGRLWAINIDKLRFSTAYDPWHFAATDYHILPGQPLGAHPLRDGLAVFTKAGVYFISGIDLELTDDLGNPQQRVDLLSSELIMYARAGVVSWRGGVIVPCTSGIWLMDTVGAPVDISRSIRRIYRKRAVSGAVAGQAAVFKDHYLLPLVDTETGEMETWVCRLDAPGFPWVKWTGFGGRVRAWAKRESPRGGGVQLFSTPSTGNRVVEQTPAFDPDTSLFADADGSAYGLKVVTRGFRVPQFSTLEHVELRDLNTSGWAVSALVGFAAESEAEPLTLTSAPWLRWRTSGRDIPWFVRFVLESSDPPVALYELTADFRVKGRQA